MGEELEMSQHVGRVYLILLVPLQPRPLPNPVHFRWPHSLEFAAENTPTANFVPTSCSAQQRRFGRFFDDRPKYLTSSRLPVCPPSSFFTLRYNIPIHIYDMVV